LFIFILGLVAAVISMVEVLLREVIMDFELHSVILMFVLPFQYLALVLGLASVQMQVLLELLKLLAEWDA
jgi:hypothetical protein